MKPIPRHHQAYYHAGCVLKHGYRFSAALWHAPLIVAGLLVVMMLSGCAMTPRPQQGGNTRSVIPPVEMQMQQPQNPEGVSRQAYEEAITVTLPDGTITATARKAVTEIGGSQDLAKILKAYGTINALRSMLFMLLLAIAAFVLWKKDYPLLAVVLGIGAIASMVIGWWAGALAIVVSVFGYLAYLKGRLPI